MIINCTAACGCVRYCSSCSGVVFPKIRDAVANAELPK